MNFKEENSLDLGKVYLVGAGPGDLGLITLKGLDCIKEADVIIYDRLINKELLDYKKEDCEIIYVGKKSSNHIMPQEKINTVIAQKAKEGKVVVRLKGGDPYVFGRGGEEAEILYDENIDFEVVPGVSSAIGGLCYAGIPVTHRDFASSFHVVTGHAKEDDSLDINWKALAEEKGTVIFLMGIGNIEHITEMLISNGRRPNTPVAFVSWATRYEQKTVTTTLEYAKECIEKNKISAPALFVVGGVVSLTGKLGFFERKAMFGKTIAVTRTRNKNSKLREKLERNGARVIEVPTILIEKKHDYKEILTEKIKAKKYDCIAFTSHNSVEYFFEAMRSEKIDTRFLKNIVIVSIGSATTESMEKFGIYPDIEAKEFSGKGLAQEIVSYKIDSLSERKSEDKIIIDRVLFPCSEIATRVFEDTLENCNIDVDRVEIYTNNVNESIKDELLETFKNENIDYITFTSSSTFNNTLKLLGKENMYLLQNIKKVSIGDITSDSIKKSGLEVELQSEIATIDSIIEVILKDLK
ncbi:MAG: uroporphyrinogen-III C-methyltransferase [Peptostreptococcus sp.]|uniref:uroporphyrinogen-III C-methyltransferase n=1 Tax=Peptostreptococcus sp. TaxID=1262 RepID=UPI002FCAB87F